MDDDFQTEEELAAHYGPDGPVSAALTWIQLVLADDLRSAWPKTDPNFRLVLAQAFLWANRTHPYLVEYDLDEAAESLAGLTFSHHLWRSFEETQLAELHQAFDEFFAGHYGAGSRPRPVAPAFEIVKFIKLEAEEPVVFTEMTLVEAQAFLLHATAEGWLVAGQGVDTPPEAGWPPKPGHATL